MKYYLNAFPKSGLHLLDALVKPLTMNELAQWAGTYANNSWTMQRISAEQVTNSICYTPDNWRLIGHSCYDEDIEWYIVMSGMVHIFIHRDLRDVAVSQAHHILSDDDNLNHAGRMLYEELGDFRAVLRAVWYGIDKYPGIEARWAEYDVWLYRPNVLVLEYGDVIADLEAAADKILDYAHGVRPMFPIVGNNIKLSSSMVVTNADAMVESALDTEASPTFRKGVTGEWRQYQDVIPEWQAEKISN